MKKLFVLLLTLLVLGNASSFAGNKNKKFVYVSGSDLIQPNGQKLYIQGTNLGNWLNPEGYMFGFGRTNSAWMIDLMIKQAVGPDFAAEFWKTFKTTISRVMISSSSSVREPTPSACRSTTNSSLTKTIWD